MARVWKDRVVEKPRTFNIQNNPDGTVTLLPAPGQIIQEGTPVNATNLNGLENDLTSHKAESASQAHLAKNIGLEDTTGNFTATELEGAMSELFTNVSDGKSLVGGAITGVDDSVVIPTDPTFGDLASAIGGISTGKKWASGETENYSEGGYNDWYELITVRGLDFTPSIVLAWNNSQGGRFGVINTLNHDEFSHSYFKGPQNLVPKKLSTDIKSSEVFLDGFRLLVSTMKPHFISGTVTWIAIE